MDSCLVLPIGGGSLVVLIVDHAAGLADHAISGDGTEQGADAERYDQFRDRQRVHEPHAVVRILEHFDGRR